MMFFLVEANDIDGFLSDRTNVRTVKSVQNVGQPRAHTFPPHPTLSGIVISIPSKAERGTYIGLDGTTTKPNHGVTISRMR